MRCRSCREAAAAIAEDVIESQEGGALGALVGGWIAAWDINRVRLRCCGMMVTYGGV